MQNFHTKIERLLQYLKEDIKKNLSNLKIFDIFKSNKSILLILIDQGTMTIDQKIFKRISSEKYFKRSYHHFFFPEILPLIDKEKFNIQDEEINSDDENQENESNNSEDDDESNNSSDDDNNDDSDYYDCDDNEDFGEDFFYDNEFVENMVKNFSEKLPENFLKQRKIGQNDILKEKNKIIFGKSKKHS